MDDGLCCYEIVNTKHEKAGFLKVSFALGITFRKVDFIRLITTGKFQNKSSQQTAYSFMMIWPKCFAPQLGTKYEVLSLYEISKDCVPGSV